MKFVGNLAQAHFMSAAAVAAGQLETVRQGLGGPPCKLEMPALALCRKCMLTLVLGTASCITDISSFGLEVPQMLWALARA